MANPSRSRKRAKQESDDDNGIPATSSKASHEADEHAVPASTRPASKRRRLSTTASVQPSSTPAAPVVATSTSTRRRRKQSSSAKPSTRSAAEIAVKEEQVDEDFAAQQRTAHVVVKTEDGFRESIVVSDTSTLSSLSDAGESDAPAVKKEEDGDNILPIKVQQSTVKTESDVEEPSTQLTRKYTRAEKGKGRAQSAGPNQQLQEEAARLRTELAKLKKDLSEAHTSIERHKTVLSRVHETFTCNICLEALRHPLALTCGHVFCQDDLWNWFHREPEADDASDSFDSLDDFSDEDFDSDGSLSSNYRTMRHLLPGRVARRAERREDSQGSDLMPVEDDYNTDDLPEDSNSEASSPPVSVRRGARIQTTRGQQVGLRRTQASAQPDTSDRIITRGDVGQRDVQLPVNEGEGTGDAAHVSVPPPGGEHVDQPATQGTPFERGQRVPALDRPRRKNLVCPQCRSRVSIPPFPVFILRDLTDLLASHTDGRRAQSMQTERQNANIGDDTWGGLFPRAASGVGRYVPGVLPTRAAAPQPTGTSAEPDDHRRQSTIVAVQENTRGHDQIPDEEREVDELKQDEDTSDNSVDSDHLEDIRAQLRRARESGEVLPAVVRARAELYNLTGAGPRGEGSVVGPSAAHQSATGLLRRHEAEHLQVNDRSRAQNLANLVRLRSARRRAHRAARHIYSRVGGVGSATWEGDDEDRLQDIEDRAISAVRRELLLSRVNRPRQHANASRSRDILRHGIRDAEDGVRRCVDCNWEIEEGTCQHCGAVYDSESEFDDNGDDLEDVTSPARGTQGPSELSFIDQDPESARAMDSYADDTDEDDGEILDGSDAEDSTDASNNTDGDSDQDIRSRQRARVNASRKRHQFLLDSDDGSQEEEEEEDESNFFVDDGQIEHMVTSEADGFLDDDEEAEETDREERRERREQRRQARAARRLGAHQSADSSDPSSEASDSSEDNSESGEDGPEHSTLPTSPSSKIEEEDEDGLLTMSSHRIPGEAHDHNKNGRSAVTARERAARAAMSRNAKTDTNPIGTSDDQVTKTDMPASAPARRKRVIQASDEE